MMLSSAYGTYDCTEQIYDKPLLSPDHPNDVFVFISRVLQTFSDSIHHRTKPCNLSESEAAYCHHGIWPLLNLVVNQIYDTNCRFRVGKTNLNAVINNATYLADGTMYIGSSALEVLLLEASGYYGKHDTVRNAYDHIKAAFGMSTMIKAILRKYHNADPTLLHEARVLFIHASSRDNIRLWQMRPTLSGKLLLLERLGKRSICLDPTDIDAMANLMRFLWNKSTMWNKQSLESRVHLRGNVLIPAITVTCLRSSNTL
ncbi:uncharacterized protein BX664DRAFT_344421 [Halteromyces radiatus]|uniref:uncharacterized protein n=1 Tax=Halteromyces radiatus TaxID=101107 RepID=UPI00222010AD|nr:uncharacterized protein BX664DRAFT_344421 [Halteromyces radiatus]KAI8076337.1 hypothetical protein BX664DRAFT_344421 [Halteromyces radiatus]